jgi:hypothetical protein
MYSDRLEQVPAQAAVRDDPSSAYYEGYEAHLKVIQAASAEDLGQAELAPKDPHTEDESKFDEWLQGWSDAGARSFDAAPPMMPGSLIWKGPQSALRWAPRLL